MASTPITVRGLPPSVTLLVRAAHDRERGAWEELVARYQGLVHAVVGSFRLQEADVADAVQNTWLRALERLDTVRDPQCLGGWLATVARRECLALLARASRESPMELDDDLTRRGWSRGLRRRWWPRTPGRRSGVPWRRCRRGAGV